ncbi:hypothetical protein RIF29_07959 [Crotalaria pallida]|uniref:Uncharacterized protein n=1 Tax=Crotalaria pallida TaxID=3830 RepID=A0AAN9PBM3_CROPI
MLLLLTPAAIKMNDDVDVDVDEDDHHHHHHHVVHAPLNNNNTNSNSMVVIRDDDECSVFPPINHENLQILSQPQPSPSQSPSPSSSSSSTLSSFSPSDSDASPSLSPSNANAHRLTRGSDFVAWMGMGLTILRSKLFAIVSSFRNRGASQRRALSSFGLPAGAVVITQLLHQIAQMNEILIARHKALAAKVVE